MTRAFRLLVAVVSSVLIFAAVAAVGTSVAFAAGYTVTDIGDLTTHTCVVPPANPFFARGSSALAINRAGVVTGWSYYYCGGDSSRHVILFDGTLKDLGVLPVYGGWDSVGTAINDAGQIAGYSSAEYGGFSPYHPFRWTSGTWFDPLYPVCGVGSAICEGQAFGINNYGDFAGWANDRLRHTGYYAQAFLSRGGNLVQLGTLGGLYSLAYDVNNHGRVVGDSWTSAGTPHAFLWDGIMRDLGTLGGTTSTANAINDAGQIVGTSATAGDAAQHAFLFVNGSMKDLGTLGGSNSAALGLNAAGDIVGESTTAHGDMHAFVAARRDV